MYDVLINIQNVLTAKGKKELLFSIVVGMVTGKNIKMYAIFLL